MIVEEFPIVIAAQWFQVENGSLVMTATGRSWIERHRNKLLDGARRLVAAAEAITPRGSEWTLVMTFKLTSGRPLGHEMIRHSFFVLKRNDVLVFEPFILVDSAGH